MKIIIDVDLAEDVDDAGALAVLHALANRGEAEILGVLVSSKNEFVVPALDAINTWYGRPDLPIGYQRGHQYGYRNPKDPDRETTFYVQGRVKPRRSVDHLRPPSRPPPSVGQRRRPRLPTSWPSA